MSSKTLTSAFKTAVSQENIVPFHALELLFSPTPAYVATTPFDITFDSKTFIGAGYVGKIDNITESASLTVSDIMLTLTGVDPTLLGYILSHQFKGKRAVVHYGLLEIVDSKYQVVQDPVIIFRGKMEKPRIVFEDRMTISVHVKSNLGDWEIPRISRYTNADQQALYPGDLGLQYIEAIQEKTLRWGEK